MASPRSAPTSKRPLFIRKRKFSFTEEFLPVLFSLWQCSELCLDFFWIFPTPCSPQLYIGLKCRMAGTLVGTWAGATKSTYSYGCPLLALILYVLSGGRELDFIDQFFFFYSLKMLHFLFIESGFRIPSFLLVRLPGELRFMTRCAGTGSGSSVTWFHLPPSLTVWPWGEPLKGFVAISPIRTLPLYLCAWVWAKLKQ